jgi:PAS domain S-box-containing protein
MTLLFWIVLILLVAGLAGGGTLWQRLNRQLTQTRQALQSAQEKVDRFKQNEALHTSTTDRLRSYLHLMDALINTIPNPIYFKDAQGIFQGCNKVFAKQILGLSRAGIIGQRAQDMSAQIPADLAATYQREEHKMIQKGGEHNFEAPVQCADGRQRAFLFSIAPVRDQADELSGSVAILADLTDQNLAALDRIHKEKLEGVLETTGAVCHEFNQPLQALSGYAELLAVKLDPQDPAAGYLKQIETQIERLRTITDTLQGITRYETTEYAGNTRIIDIHKSSVKA